MGKFQAHNGFSRTFQENKLTIGLSFPFELFVEKLQTIDSF